MNADLPPRLGNPPLPASELASLLAGVIVGGMLIIITGGMLVYAVLTR